jgi:hypothetical protein
MRSGRSRRGNQIDLSLHLGAGEAIRLAAAVHGKVDKLKRSLHESLAIWLVCHLASAFEPEIRCL